MKVTVSSGDGDDKESREIDTTALPDLHADVLEKATEFCELCKQYNINVGVIFEGETFNTYTFFHVGGTWDRVKKFWMGMDHGLGEFSRGTLRLIFNPHGHEEQ